MNISDYIKNLASDKRKHLKVGCVLAIAVGVLVLLALWKPWAAIAAGGTGACLFVEWYQRDRGNGQAEWGDLVAGALPAWLLAAIVAVW